MIVKFITENSETSLYAEKYKDPYAISDIVGYVQNYDKTGGMIGGWGVNPGTAAQEMELLAKLWHKQEGTRLRHWVITFSEEELERITERLNCSLKNAMMQLGYAFSRYYANEYQIVFGVHRNTEHPHIHFVMNTVAYTDGHKYTGTKAKYDIRRCGSIESKILFGFCHCLREKDAMCL